MSKTAYNLVLASLFAALLACIILAVHLWAYKDMPLENGWPTWQQSVLSGAVCAGIFLVVPAIVANLCRKKTSSGVGEL